MNDQEKREVQREAFQEGIAQAHDWLRQDGFRNACDCLRAYRNWRSAAQTRYPALVVRRPREVADPEVPGWSFRVKDKVLEARYSDTGTWSSVFGDGAFIALTEKRVAILHDLFTNPDEEVPDA